MFPSTLAAQRIFILGSSIFEEGIAHILRLVNGLHVSGDNYTNDASFLENIEQSQPDVILINETSQRYSARLLDLLLSLPSRDGRRVIVVRLNSNVIDVYDLPRRDLLKFFDIRKQFIISKRDDLVAQCVRIGD